jgi:hypothetical protein
MRNLYIINGLASLAVVALAILAFSGRDDTTPPAVTDPAKPMVGNKAMSPAAYLTKFCQGIADGDAETCRKVRAAQRNQEIQGTSPRF